MNTRVVRLMLSSLIVLLAVAGGVGPQRPVVASDHDEAPFFSLTMDLNTPDYYEFADGGANGLVYFLNPQMIGVPSDPATFNDADTVLHFDQFIEAGMGPSTVAFEFSAFNIASTQPLELGFSNGSTARYDVEVTDSPTTPSTGSVELFENTAGTGGSAVVDITLYLYMTFTNTVTGAVTVVDGGAENLPIEVEGSASYSYDCPPGYVSIPNVTADFCLGHFPNGSSVFPTTLIDINNLNDPTVVWRVRPATAPVNPNRSPILDPIGPLMGIEGQTNTFPFAATDPDGDMLFWVVGGDVPRSGCRVAATGPQSATYACDPTTVAGVYGIVVTVADPNGAIDVENVTLTIKPFLEAGPNQTVSQGDQVPLSPSASIGATIDFDLDGDEVFETPGPTTIFDTTALAAGNYSIGVRATKNGAESIDSLTVTVVATNTPPILDVIDDVSVDEGRSLNVAVNANDPDGDNLVFTFEGLPSFVEFVDNQDGSGELVISPGFADAGVVTVTARAADDGDPSLFDEDTFTITILNVNQSPSLAPIDDLTVGEDQSASIVISASDPDAGDTLVLTSDGPDFVTLIDNGDGTGTLTVSPGPQDHGTFTVQVFATDDGDPMLFVAETFTVTVTNVNQSPILEPIANVTVDEGDTFTFTVSAADPDDDTLTLTATLPAFASLTDNGDGTGTVALSPDFDDAGTYTGSITVTDVAVPPGTDDDTFTIMVIDVNRAPVLEGQSPQLLAEGDTLTLTINASDPDGDAILISGDVPPFCVINDAGDGSAQLECSPGSGDAGEYSVFINVTDSGSPPLVAESTFTITVTEGNQPPVFAPVGNASVPEGIGLSLTLTATDPNGDDLTITEVDLPPFGTVFDQGSGVATLQFAPGHTDAGDYTITVRATDDGDPNLSSETTFTLTVTEVNLPPLIDVFEDLTVDVGSTGTLTITGTDPDGDGLSYTADLPPFCLLNDIGDGSADIQCNPDKGDAGDHPGLVTVTDDGDPPLIDSSMLTILVVDQNRSPNIDSVSGQTTVSEGQTTTIQVSASDPDGDNLTMTLEDDPPFCTIVDNGGGSATITCSPGFNDAGSHTFRVFATDDGTPTRAAGASITIVVNNVNRPPALDAVDDQTVVEDGELFGTFTATDPDVDAITFSASGLLGFCVLTDNGDGSAFFECHPEVGDAGQYIITITASDGGQPTTRSFRLTVQPKISLNVPPSANDGEFVRLEADCQSCGNAVAEYVWDLNGDNVFDDAVGPNPTINTSALALGTNQLAVQGCLPGIAICNIVSGTLSVQPTLVVDGLYRIFTERTTTFTAHTSRDSDIFTYEWDLDGDDEFDDVVGQSVAVDTFLVNSGNYTWSVRAFPPDNSFSVISDFAFEIVDADGVTAGGPYSTALNVAVEVSAGCPSCGDNIVSWSWDLDHNGQGDATGQTTTFTSGTLGEHVIAVTACLDAVVDPASCETAETTVDVGSGNRPPVLEPIGPQETSAGGIIDRPLFASDPDGDQITISGIGLPPFCEIEQAGDGEVYLLCSPGSGDAGMYTFTIVAQDDGEPALQDTETITLTVRPGANAGGPYTVTQGASTLLSATGPAEFTYVWDLDGDGVFESPGQSVVFDASTLDPGLYPVQLQVCLTGGLLCNEDDTDVIVEGPSIETYDELESLVRAYVDNPLVERLLTAPLALAQYFDEVLGIEAAARPLLRTFIRLVERFTPFFIDPEAAQQMIDFAEALIENLE